MARHVLSARDLQISKELLIRPKLIVEIGGRPILWHRMEIYSAVGVTEYIILQGYKDSFTKVYFTTYFLRSSDISSVAPSWVFTCRRQPRLLQVEVAGNVKVLPVVLVNAVDNAPSDLEE